MRFPWQSRAARHESEALGLEAPSKSGYRKFTQRPAIREAVVSYNPVFRELRFRFMRGPDTIRRVDSTVSLLFRYSEQDFVRAMRAHYASRLRLRIDIAVTVLMAVIGVYLWRSPESPWYGMALLSLSGTFALMLVAAFGIIPYVVFRRETKFRDEYALTFSPDGIHFRTAHIDSQLQWGMYSRALVDSHSFVLHYGARSFTVIPKRVFQSFEQQTAFEQLLAQKVPKIIKVRGQ